MRRSAFHPRSAGGLLVLSLLALQTGLAPAGTAWAAGPAAPVPPKSPVGKPASPAEKPSGSFTVYFPDEGTETAAPSAAQAPASRPADEPGALGIGILVVALMAGALGWLRLRSPLCPRCREKLVELEREEGEGVAAERPALEVRACLSCGEVVKRRYRMLTTRDLRCPACGAASKVSRLETLERPGYLTWGQARLHEECATCSYRVGDDYAVPPLEAPVTRSPARNLRP